MKMSELVLVSQGGRAAQVSDFQDKPVFRQYFCSDLNQALTPTKMEITLNHNQFSKLRNTRLHLHEQFDKRGPENEDRYQPYLNGGHQVNIPPYSCDVCNKRYSTKFNI